MHRTDMKTIPQKNQSSPIGSTSNNAGTTEGACRAQPSTSRLNIPRPHDGNQRSIKVLNHLPCSPSLEFDVQDSGCSDIPIECQRLIVNESVSHQQQLWTSMGPGKVKLNFYESTHMHMDTERATLFKEEITEVASVTRKKQILEALTFEVGNKDLAVARLFPTSQSPRP